MKFSKRMRMSILLIIVAVFLILSSFAYIKYKKEKKQEPYYIDEVSHAKGIEYVPGELIVKIKKDIKDNFANILECEDYKNAFLGNPKLCELGRYNITNVRHLFPNFTFEEKDVTALTKKEYMPVRKERLSRVLKFKFSSDTDILSVTKEIEALPYIEYAEPNYIYYASEFPEDLPNDTYVDPDGDNLWSVGSWGQDFEDMWGLKRINMQEGWPLSEGENIVVAVVDTGIDYTHEDLKNNIWFNEGELPLGFDPDGLEDYNGDGIISLKDLIDVNSPYIDGIDNDENGFPDDLLGWDFINDDNDPFDDHYHGSHVAGTVGAEGNNEIGIIGVAPKVKLMAVKGLGSNGTGPVSGLIQCIEYAADNGAEVINCSFGGPGESEALQNAIKDAHYIKGCVVAAAAGNTNSDAANEHPANISEAITIANMTPAGWKSSTSNYGSVIDIIAPGTQILSVNSAGGPYADDGEYLVISGTSMACPHVSGLAALILSMNSLLTNEQINQIIRTTATDLSGPDGNYPGWDIYTGYGLIDAYAALQKEGALACRITEPKTGYELTLPWETFEIKGIATGPGFQSYSIEIQRENEPIWQTIVANDPVSHTYSLDDEGNPVFDTLGFLDIALLDEDGNYIIKLTAKDINDNTYEDRIRIYIQASNSPPVLAPIGNKTVNEMESLEFTINATDPDTDDVLQYSVNNLPAYAEFYDQIFSWMPFFDQAGVYMVEFIVSDGLSTDSEIIEITVNNVNAPPRVAPIEDKTINEGELLEFTVTASDPDDDSVTLGVEDLPIGASFNTQTGEFSWTPNFLQAGDYTVTFTASDGQLTVEFPVPITVNNVNRPPELAPIGNKTVNEMELLEFTIDATDPDGDVLQYSASNLPIGANFINTTRTFKWKPSYSQAGSYSIIFYVRDSSGLLDSETIGITVNDVNTPPVFTPIPQWKTRTHEGETLVFTVSATDPEGDNITLNVDNLPAGAIFNSQTGEFTWTPNFLQAGVYAVVFTAIDEHGASTSITISIGVLNKIIPPPTVIINLIPYNPNYNIGDGITIRVTATSNIGLQSIKLQKYGFSLLPGPPEITTINLSGETTYTVEQTITLQRVGLHRIRVVVFDTLYGIIPQEKHHSYTHKDFWVIPQSN